MTLLEMADSYRREAEILRDRIRLVRALPVGDGTQAQARAERLRLLDAMYRDVRSVAGICAHYYERDHWRNERYSL